MLDNNKPSDLYIISEKFNLCIKIKPNGYIPKSGFLLINSMHKFSFLGKVVADVGCGETGIIAHYLYARQADSVWGIDIDFAAIEHAKKCSNVSGCINWLSSDFCFMKNKKFDVIVSNPPQMPMSNKNRRKLSNYHDSPGKTGKELIFKILKESSSCLNKDGAVFMLIFDFLGVTESYNSFPSVKTVSREYGFSCDIIDVYSSVIRNGGQTEKNISWIKSIYPKYNFKKDDSGNLCYNTMVVKFQL